MKIEIMQSSLNRALAQVKPYVGTRSTLPILGTILFVADGDNLRLSATNLEQGLHCWVDCRVIEPGAIALPVGILTDLISSLSDVNLTIELNQKTLTVTIRGKGSNSSIKGLNAEDFPAIPTYGEAVEAGRGAQSWASFECVPAALSMAMAQAVVARSVDTSRPTMTGVECTVKDGYFSFAATDGFRLAISKRESSAVDGTFTAIIPGNTITGAIKLLEGANAVSVAITDRQITFAIRSNAGFSDLSSQLIDARFPDYSGIIPKSHNMEATVNVEELISTLKVAAIFARDNSDRVNFNFRPDSLEISATGAELGDTSATIYAQVSGDGFPITLNAAFAMQTLKAMNCKDIVISGMNPTRPLTFRPADGGDSVLHVVMPMMQAK